MTITNITIIILSSAVVSGIVTTVLRYIFDLRKNKNERLFHLKQEAYMGAVDAISGASETIFDYIIKKQAIEKRINPITIIEFNAAYTRKIAPATLVATQNIRDSLKKFSSLIIECAEIVESLSATAKKKGDEFKFDASSTEAEQLREWKRRIKELEENLVIAMQKDLGLNT